ncbi:MAG: ANTAR domain-containing protein [Sedimenticola sp.]|nr:ANTAR domain-containing protein [Sedimenticola sp.]
MKNVMLVKRESSEQASGLQQALADQGWQLVGVCAEPGRLVERAETWHPELVVIELPSPDRVVLEQVRLLAHRLPCPVVMFAESAGQAATAAAIDAGMHAFVVDGFDPRRLRSILEVAAARFNVHRTLQEELLRTRAALDQRKLVDRARGILMRKRDWSEDQAYRALQKMAMDQNRRLVEVARRVIEMESLFE